MLFVLQKMKIFICVSYPGRCCSCLYLGPERVRAPLMLSGSGRPSVTPGLDCCSHASALLDEFLYFYENISQVPSCWVLACVQAYNLTATVKLNKQLGSRTGSPGPCSGHPWKNGNGPHAGGVGNSSIAGKQAELNERKLLLVLVSAGCQLFSVSALMCHLFSSFCTLAPTVDHTPWSHRWFLCLLPWWLERWMLLPQAADQTSPLSDKH